MIVEISGALDTDHVVLTPTYLKSVLISQSPKKTLRPFLKKKTPSSCFNLTLRLLVASRKYADVCILVWRVLEVLLRV